MSNACALGVRDFILQIAYDWAVAIVVSPSLYFLWLSLSFCVHISCVCVCMQIALSLHIVNKLFNAVLLFNAALFDLFNYFSIL